jgi:hypothetical protein
LSQSELNDHFLFSFGNVIRVLNNVDNYNANDIPCGDDWNVEMNMLANFFDSNTFPSTCNYNDYMNGEPCLFKFVIPTVNIELQFQVQSCDTNPQATTLPYFSISCSGDLCHDFFRPCAVDADCHGNNKCLELDQDFLDEFAQGMAEIADAIGVFTNGTECSIPGSTEIFNFDNVGEHIRDYFWASLALVMEAPNPTSFGVGLCGDDAFNDTMWEHIGDDMGYMVNNTASGGEGEELHLNLYAWDGVLLDGVDAVSDSRYDGLAFPDLSLDIVEDANEVVILHSTCDGRMALKPNSPISLQGGGYNINAFLEMLHEMFYPLAECSSNGDVTEKDFEYQYKVHSPGFWLDILTNYTRTDRVFDYDFTDMGDSNPLNEMRNMIEDLFDGDVMGMPSSCDPISWENDRRCDFDWEYLGELFTDPFTLRFQFEECPGYFGFPKFTFKCLASTSICEDLFEAYTVDACVQDSDCPGTDTCNKFSFEENQEDFIANALYNANTTYGFDIPVYFSSQWEVYNKFDEAWNWNNLTEQDWQDALEEVLNHVQAYTERCGHTYLGTDDETPFTWTTDFSQNYFWYDMNFILRPTACESYSIDDDGDDSWYRNYYTWYDSWSFIMHCDALAQQSLACFLFEDYSITAYEDTLELRLYTWDASDGYTPCADGSYDLDGSGCTYDECANPIAFNNNLFNWLREVLQQPTGSADASIGEELGMCQTAWETAIESDDAGDWGDNLFYNETYNNGRKYRYFVTGMVSLAAADIDECDTCEGGCDNSGTCDNSAPEFNFDNFDTVNGTIVDPIASTGASSSGGFNFSSANRESVSYFIPLATVLLLLFTQFF